MKKNRSISKNEAILRLKDLCSRSEKSAAEIKKKLALWGLSQHSEPIIQELRNEKFIDDARFAGAFVHDKIHFNKWGKIKVRYQLRHHDVNDNAISGALENVDEDRYIEMIRNELQKKSSTIKESNPFKRKAKILSFAQQRGYETDIVKRFLNE